MMRFFFWRDRPKWLDAYDELAVRLILYPSGDRVHRA